MVIHEEKAFNQFKASFDKEYGIYKKVNLKMALIKFEGQCVVIYGEVVPLNKNIKNRINILVNLEPFYIIDGVISKAKIRSFIKNFPEKRLTLGMFKIDFRNQFKYIHKRQSKRHESLDYFCEEYDLIFEYEDKNKCRKDTLWHFHEEFEDIVWETKNLKGADDAIREFFNVDFSTDFPIRMKWYLPKYAWKIYKIKLENNVLSIENKFIRRDLQNKVFVKIIGERHNQVIFREASPIAKMNEFALTQAPSNVIISIVSEDELFDKIERQIDISDEQIELGYVNFIRNQKLRKIIARDIVDAKNCYSTNAWKPTIVMCGSILEAILVSELNKRRKKIISIYQGKYGKSLSDFNKLNLAQMIDIAIELKLINKDILSVGHSLRKFRNYIHPTREMDKDSIEPDESLAAISLNLVDMITKELSKRSRKA